MSEVKHTLSGNQIAALMSEVFRLNHALLATADELVADLGLTSARWQILGVIKMSDQPKPVAWIAREMGLSRQAIQRVVNDMSKTGLVEFKTNPHHARAQYVVLTDKGSQILTQAIKRQADWVNQLADELNAKDINAARQLLSKVTERLIS